MKASQVKRFIAYLVERENIRVRKLEGKSAPWTKDPILSKYKFTNVRRVNDRTTQTFLKLYKLAMAFGPKLCPDSTLLYNCGVFRYFGTEAFAKEIGIQKKHDSRLLAMTVATLRNQGIKAFTGAYMITNANRPGPKENVVAGFLQGLWDARLDILKTMRSERSWKAGHEAMRTLDGFGGMGFMAKEVLQDYLLLFPDDVDDGERWTPIGPGARAGLNRIWGRPAQPQTQQKEEQYEADCLTLMNAVQGPWLSAHRRTGSLTAHDVQFCLCEFDKYERTRLGEGRPRSKYTPHKEE